MEQVKIFLDTNIVLDYYTGRMGDGLAAKTVQVGQLPEYVVCISALTGINVLYVSKKLDGHLSLDNIADLFEILDVTGNQWKTASVMQIADPEDALQLACAVDCGCRVLITRDRHLLELGNNYGIMILSPADFLNMVTIDL